MPPIVSERPKISFVFAVHDPEYGGGLLASTQRHIDALIALANRYRLLSEIIIVEWNPRPDRARFRGSLRWPDDLGHVCLRFIEVPAEIHRTLPNADRIPIFEYIAKNAGLRRARGQFLLATNPDLFYSPALIRWLARTSLSSERFYRVDRRDLSEEIPGDVSLSRQLRFCSQHVAQVNALIGWYRPGDADGLRRLRDEYDRRMHDTASVTRWTDTSDARLMFPVDGLHRNAAGDFFLMEREWWHRLRGYPELYTHAHIDAILCWVASSATVVQEILPSRCRLYHQIHHRASHVDFPQTDWRPWYERYEETLRQDPLRPGSPMVVNGPDWGLANEVLPEWHASPRLIQVQVLTSEVEARRFGNSLDAAENPQRTLMEKLSEAEAALATTRSDLQRAQAGREAARQDQAALRAATRQAQRADKAEREAARAALEAAQREAQVAQQSEAALRRELDVILGSTIWRASGPLRMAAGKLPSSLRSVARTGLQGVYWALTPWNSRKRVQFLRERYRENRGKAVLETPPVDSGTDAPNFKVREIVPDVPPPVTLRLHPVPSASEPHRTDRSGTTAMPFAGTIICLSHVIPLPPRAGNEYRIHRMLVRLRQSGYRIVLVVSPQSPQDIDDARWCALAATYGNVVYCERDGQIRYRLDECPDVLTPLEGQPTPHYAAILDEARPLLPAEVELLRVDRSFCPDALIATLVQLQSSLAPCAVLAEYVWMTRGLPLLDPGLLTVLDTIDVLSTDHEKLGAFGISGLQVRPEDEAQRLARAKVLVAIRPEEARLIGNLAPGHDVVTAGVDFDVVERIEWPAKPVVFCVGSDNARNLLGLRDFLKFAWPEIRRAVPGVRLAVAGSIGTAVPDYLQDVDVLGNVDDLGPVYKRARVVVNPAVAGTGLKVKTVEALSRLRPIVTWPNGVDGLPTEMAALMPPAQDWLDFAERAIAWLRSETPAFNAATATSIRHLLSSDHVYAGLEARLARYFDAQRSHQPS
jgi:hypothetical protein